MDTRVKQEQGARVGKRGLCDLFRKIKGKSFRTALKYGIASIALSVMTIGVINQYQEQGKWLHKHAIEQSVLDQVHMLIGNVPHYVNYFGTRTLHAHHIDFNMIGFRLNFNDVDDIIETKIQEKYKVEFERVANEIQQFVHDKQLLVNPNSKLEIKVLPQHSSDSITWKASSYDGGAKGEQSKQIIVIVPSEIYAFLLSSKSGISPIIQKILDSKSINDGVFTFEKFSDYDKPPMITETNYFCEQNECFSPERNLIFQDLSVKYYDTGWNIFDSYEPPHITYEIAWHIKESQIKTIDPENKEEQKNMIKILHKKIQHQLYMDPDTIHRSEFWLPLKEKDIPMLWEQLIKINNEYNQIAPMSVRHMSDDELSKYEVNRKDNELFFTGDLSHTIMGRHNNYYDPYFFKLIAQEKFGHLWVTVYPVRNLYINKNIE